MVGRHARAVGGCAFVVAAFSLIDCAGILGINPTIVENGEGGSGGGTSGPAFQAPTIAAKQPVIDKSCASAIRPIYTDDTTLGIGPIVADENGVFFGGDLSAEEGYVRALTTSGTVTVTDVGPGAKGFALDHDHLYVSRMVTYNGIQGPADIVQCSRADLTDQLKLSFGATSPGSGWLVLDANELYFGTFTFTSGSVLKVAAPFTTSTTPETLESNVPSPYNVAVDSSWIYFDEAPAGFSVADGYTQTKLLKAPRDGSGTPTVLEDNTNVQQIVVVNGKVFWSTGRNNSVNIYDGSSTSDYAQLQGPSALAVDAEHNHLYVAVTNDAGGQDIIRMPLDHADAKPQMCVSGFTNNYSMFFFGGDLFFGASNDDDKHVLYDVATIP